VCLCLCGFPSSAFICVHLRLDTLFWPIHIHIRDDYNCGGFEAHRVSDLQTSNSLADQAPRKPSLGTQAARGAVWATVPAVIAKLTGFGADIVLAWFLTPNDFGAVGLAVAVAAVFGMIQQAGLRDILTQRQKRFARWSTPGFWMALALGILCTIGMACFGPVAAKIWRTPVLSGLVMLMSVRCLLDALAILPQSKLQIQLRYRAIGGVAAMCTLIQAGLSVLLASKLFGWGPYAMCAPMVLTSLLQAAAFWWLARPSLKYQPQFRRWRWISRDAGFAMATGLVTIAVGYGDNSILGLIRNPEVVGVYFFAYRLAVQANQLVVTNLSSVLFSALSQLHTNRHRQVEATMSAARILSIVAMPLNCIQAAAANPLFRLLYGAKWEAAIVPFQLLSIGMALALVGAPSTSLMKAQGRFGFYFYWSAALSVVYLCMISVGASLAGAVGVAGAAAIYYGVFGIAGLRVAVGKFPSFWPRAVHACLVPLVLSVIAGGLAMISREFIPSVRDSNLLSVAWIVFWSFAFYLALIRFVMADAWHELMDRIRAMLLHRRRL